MTIDSRAASPPDSLPPLASRRVPWLDVLLSCAIAALFLAQVCGYAAYAERGEPGCGELTAALGGDPQLELDVDLTRLPLSRGHRRIPLPDSWLPPEGQVAPRIRAFIDGQPVPFYPDAASVTGHETGSWVYYREPTTRSLRVACGENLPCRRALVVREGGGMWLRVLLRRIVARPGALALACLGALVVLRVAAPRLARASRPFLILVLATLAAIHYFWWSRLWFTSPEATGLIALTGVLSAVPLLLRLWPGRRSDLLLLAVAVAAFSRALWWTVLPECNFTLGTDEGMYIHGAQRILSGELPNRDFFSFLGPVSYAILALVGMLRGAVLAADARMVAVACSLTGAFVYAHLVSQGRGLTRWPLYAVSLALAIEFETGPGSFFTFSHHAVSMLFAGIALLACAPGLREDRAMSHSEIRACGLATSLTLMSTTNLGAYLTLAFSAWLAIDGWLNGQRRRLVDTLVRYWLWVASLPTLYACLHLAIRNGERLYRELVEFLFVNYVDVNAANLDYLFFFRLRLQDAFRQYLEDASLPGLLASIGVSVVLFMGHVPALALGVWALVKVSRSSGTERAFCRTTLLLALFYVAMLSTTLTNPFVSNISTHARPAFVLLIGWLLYRPPSSSSLGDSGRHRFGEALVAALLVAWAAQLPNWRNAPRPAASTRLGVLTYGSERQYSDEQQVLALLQSRLNGLGLVAYHYYAPRWYAYFPEAQRLRSYVLVPFLSPTSHYQEALTAMQQGAIRYAIEDRSFELNAWDPRVRFSTLEETNGAAFYQYIRINGRKVLSNDSYTVWELPGAGPGRPAEHSSAARRARRPEWVHMGLLPVLASGPRDSSEYVRTYQRFLSLITEEGPL